MTDLTDSRNHTAPRRACGSWRCSCDGCHALPDGGDTGLDGMVGVPASSEVVLRCGRGDIAAGVRHLDSIARARREAEERVERMRNTVIFSELVIFFPPFA